MGTGGTLPTNITQTVTLYNTTGVIEKDKGIYFCPFLSTSLTGVVASNWLSAFVLEAQSDSDYSTITISSWNPKDRTLTIKGNPDDFRIYSEQGKCLNYLILTRVVTNPQSTAVTNYYSFFITDVEQVGQGSVRLTLQSDDFTDVFYLHNKKLCSSYSGSYVDVFNERLKNCYVARQHYNRVKSIIKTKTSTASSMQHVQLEEVTDVFYTIPNINIPEPTLSVERTEVINYTVKVNNVDRTANVTSIWLTKINNVWTLHIQLDYLVSELSTISCTYTIKQFSSEYEQDNLPIFSQIEEGFKYKRQFRDYKEFINYGDPLTAEEKQAYEEAESWSDLTEDLKIKALKLSTAFIHVVLNTNKCMLARSGLPQKPIIKTYLPNVGVRDNLLRLTMPIYNEIKELSKFKSNISPIFNNILIKWYGETNTYPATGKIYNGVSFYFLSAFINLFLNEQSAYTTYVQSCYISKESSLLDKMVFTDSSITLKLLSEASSDLWSNEPNLLKPIFFISFYDSSIIYNPDRETFLTPTEITDLLDAEINGDKYASITEDVSTDLATLKIINHSDLSEDTQHKPFFMVMEDLDLIEFNLDLDDSKVNKNLKEDYFDTVLTFNPYSFYSVSYLGRIEVPLNKLNYYENPVITCNLSVLVGDTFRYSFVPTYTINGLQQKMYSESIEQTLTNQLTVVNSQLVQYRIANISQMKNQYAVNELNHEYGLITTAVSGVGNIVGGSMKGALVEGGFGGLAGAGAVTGAVQTATGLITEAIDWDKDTKQIAMNQKAKLSDMGNLPSNLKQVGTDITIDLNLNELGLYLNHYTIDEVSYNSICKYLERFGYMVNIYDTLNVNTRKGWDYVQLLSFDYDANITVEQEESIRQILQNGVTLLHDHDYMVSGHNYEIILD